MTSDQPSELGVHCADETATHALGRLVGQCLENGVMLALSGPLGAGKTCLIRGIADGLGIDPRDVVSPTFTLCQEYRGRLPMVHWDWYRIASAAELESLGLDQFLDGSFVVAIEWADRFPSLLVPDRVDIGCQVTDGQRLVRFQLVGPLQPAGPAGRFFSRLRAALEDRR